MLSVNTGTLEATVDNPNLTTLEYALSNTNNSYNIVPFKINYLNNTSANCDIPASTAAIVAGLILPNHPQAHMPVSIQRTHHSHIPYKLVVCISFKSNKSHKRI